MDEEERDRQTPADIMECAQYLYFFEPSLPSAGPNLLLIYKSQNNIFFFFVKTVLNMSERKRKTQTKLSSKASHICKIAIYAVYIDR